MTPKELPEWSMFNALEAHPFGKGGLYFAATRYKLDDFRPLLYKTTDYGKSWTKITGGIDPGHFTRVVRADPDRRGLLYAGTENGLYLSIDDGASWQKFQGNLPIVPITDLAVKDRDLIAATQGRGYWILDDLRFCTRCRRSSRRPTFSRRGRRAGCMPAATARGGRKTPAKIRLPGSFSTISCPPSPPPK